MQSFEYALLAREKIDEAMCRECRCLYNEHYGIWGPGASPDKVGKPVRMGLEMLRSYFDVDGGAL